MYGGKRSVVEVPGLMEKVLWERCHAEREESCGRRLTHSGNYPVEDA